MEDAVLRTPPARVERTTSTPLHPMRGARPGAVLVLALLLGACAGIETDSREPHDPAADARATDTLRLQVRGEAHLPARGPQIRFAAVESDSRCPVDVTCVWAGDATVLLEIGVTEAAPLRLHTADAGRTAVHGTHRFELIRLLPLPRDGINIAPDEYRLEIAVSRSDGRP
jgi:hypothetical protein